jgi:hypothetical protein
MDWKLIVWVAIAHCVGYMVGIMNANDYERRHRNDPHV